MRNRLHIATAFVVSFWFSLAGTHAATAPAQSPDVVNVQVDPDTVVSRISPDFIGFGYETSAAAQPDFFSPKNVTMLQLYRTLTPHGLIRIGGNVSDHTKYEPDGVAEVHPQNEVTVINKKCLTDLGEFSKAAGWKVMWGLNLGTGSKEQATAEAVDVTAALGEQLQSLQIGNEVDFQPKFKGHYDAYHAAYADYKSAIRAALPNSVFSGPDVGGSIEWATNFAGSEARDMSLLTHHYYVGGAGDKSTSIEKMLRHDDRWEKRLQKLRQLCQDHELKYRINEVNSFSGGGKAGVSDTFASALWCLDFMFELASYDCEGVNMETDINHLAWISHYSSIVHDAQGKCSARPEYYGMLAFATAGKGDLVRLTVGSTDANFSAYATRDDQGTIRITAINKDVSRDITLQIAMPDEARSVEILRLTAPSLQSTEHVVFAGAEVAPDGTWAAKESEKPVVADKSVEVKVAHASAAVICLRR